MSAKPIKRIPILKRDDGAVFVRTPVLEVKSNMRPGWKDVFEDGREVITLDKAKIHEMDPSTLSRREKDLIEENAKLRDMLAKANGITQDPPNLVEETPVQPGETPIPDAEEIDLDSGPVPDETPIEFAPEPEMHSEGTLNRMKKEDLEAHARNLNRDIVIPEGTKRPDLIQICLDEQKAYTERQTFGE